MNKIRWILYFLPMLFINVAAILLAPVVALFIKKVERTDIIKRLGYKSVTMQREYLIDPLFWFQTHDNAVDEYWWGMYTKNSMFSYVRNATQEDYDSSVFLRYLCRLLWMWRNSAYGFSYNLFGRPLIQAEVVTEVGTEGKSLWYRYIDRGNSWQLKMQIPLVARFYIDINIGWKTHDGFSRAMYASRLISIHRD